MHMAFLSRGFKNLQWYSMTKKETPYGVSFFGATGNTCLLQITNHSPNLTRRKKPLCFSLYLSSWVTGEVLSSFSAEHSSSSIIFCSVLLCFPSTLPPLLKPTANKSATEKMARAAAGTNINMVSSVIAFSPFLSPIVYHIPVALQNSRCQSNLLILHFLSYLPVFSSSFASIVAKKLLTLPPAW